MSTCLNMNSTQVRLVETCRRHYIAEIHVRRLTSLIFEVQLTVGLS